MTDCVVDGTQLRSASLQPPLSKSDAIRALILEYIWNTNHIRPQLPPIDQLPSDVAVTLEAIKVLDAGSGRIDCRDGGAPFRILLTQAALVPFGKFEFWGTPRLAQRPHDSLIESLKRATEPAGAWWQWNGEWPLLLTSPSNLTKVEDFFLQSNESSQFLTSLLLGASMLLHTRNESVVHCPSLKSSVGYVDLTQHWLAEFGVSVEFDGAAYRLSCTGSARLDARIPTDWSSVGYLLLLAWASDSTVENVAWNSKHPDRKIVEHLESAGLKVSVSGTSVSVQGELHSGFEVDANECPDVVLTLVAAACTAPKPSVFRNVAVLRKKESDRVDAARRLVTATGASFETSENFFTVIPTTQPKSVFFIDSKDDHRTAMAASCAALITHSRATIKNPNCVAKSFPSFWAELGRIVHTSKG